MSKKSSFQDRANIFRSGKKTRLPASFTKYGAVDGRNHEERTSTCVRTVPRTSAGDFDEFLYAWNHTPVSKLTAKTISCAMEEADQGITSSQAALYRSIMEKEPAAAAHFQTRILAVLACDWSITGKDPIRAGEVSAILKKAKIHSLLHHLLSALAFGCAGAAILWEEGGGSIRSFRKIEPENWLFDAVGNPALLSFQGKEVPLAEYHPNQFVFHSHKLLSGSPARGGLLRPLLWLYFFKHYALRDRARYLEKFGIPFIIAKINGDDFENEDIRSSILASLSRIASDGSGVVTGDSEIQTLSPSGNASGEYQAWMDYIDRLFALLILGQTASSSSSSGFSKGQIQENVRRDILEADCRALMETVNTQILAPLERFRYGTEGTLSFQMDFSSPENLTDKAQIVKLLSESGFRASPEWVEETFHIRLKSQNNPETEE